MDLKSRFRSNSGYKYILFVINAFTKMAWVRSLKTKKGPEVVSAMAEILVSTTPPRNLQVDSGTKFCDLQIQQLMKKHGINMYSPFSVLKTSIVERLNRTIKNAIFRNFTVQRYQN